MENLDSGVGVYAPDAEAYMVFADLFDPIIEDYHSGFKKTDKHPAKVLPRMQSSVHAQNAVESLLCADYLLDVDLVLLIWLAVDFDSYFSHAVCSASYSRDSREKQIQEDILIGIA